jgi:uncharacterized protein (TIGR04255 family)
MIETPSKYILIKNRVVYLFLNLPNKRMSKLSKAPLIEVIFELRWDVNTLEELNKSQFLMGELYSSLKDRYPFREAVQAPIGGDVPGILIGNPMYRYRVAQEKYPLIQIGPGIISLNTIDENYYWEDFFKQIDEIQADFFKLYQANEDELFQIKLGYFDFVDKGNESTLDFINNQMSMKISHDIATFKDEISMINFSMSRNIEIGQLTFSIANAKVKGIDGLVMQTQIVGKIIDDKNNEIITWVDSAHQLCSSLFKEITHGKLYESFS